MLRAIVVPLLCSVLFFPVVVLFLNVSSAQVMSSGSYQIQSDSINIGGGYSSSTNFQSESTVGEIATGDSDSELFALRAGFQQLQEIFISISGAAPVELLPAIGGVSGGEASGSTTVTVVTDSPSGYTLTVSYETAPAMVSGINEISDYVPIGDADFSFVYSVDEAVFGFSPTGSDVVERFQNNGLACGVSGASTLEVCWAGATTTAVTLAQSTGSNHPVGATTTVNFRVGVGSAALPAPGTYVATTTLTALSL